MNSKLFNHDINNILKFIPHRYPFILIDRILCYKKKNFIRVLKNITFNDPLLQGHFPSNAIFPAVLAIESISQAAIILALRHFEKNNSGLYYIVGIEKSRFKKIIVPGDQLIIEVKIQKQYKDLLFFKGIIFVNKKIVCYATIICKYIMKTY